jgi:hypothetical protein
VRHRSFGEFVNKKKRESVRQLNLVKQLLERNGMKVDNFTSPEDEDKEPYIYCHNSTKSGSFDGVRIYKIGNDLAFRIQKESETHPYGSAYPLPIESMFYDFMSDKDVDQKKAGQKIIDAVGKEVRKFFNKSVEAEKSSTREDLEKDGQGNAIIRTTGTDYSALIYSKS